MIITYLDYKDSVNFQQIGGLYFHPHHNWFISNSMQVADLEEAVELCHGEAMNAFEK